MVAEFRAEIVALDRLSEGSQADVAAGVERNLLRWRRWLRTGVAPADADFEPLREWARARATEGVRLEDLLRLRCRPPGRLGADPPLCPRGRDRCPARRRGLLMQYTDRVSTVVTDTYLAERDVLVSEEERRTRNLLERLSDGTPLEVGEIELAERLGMAVEPGYAPFAIVLPDRPPRRHAALAARLRRRGWKLTVTEGGRVVGLASKPIDVADWRKAPTCCWSAAAQRRAPGSARPARTSCCSPSTGAGAGCAAFSMPRTTSSRSSWGVPPPSPRRFANESLAQAHATSPAPTWRSASRQRTRAVEHSFVQAHKACSTNSSGRA